MISYYELLGVSPGATDAQIKEAFQARSMICDPHFNHPGLGKAGADFLRLLNDAFRAIGTAEARAAYARRIPHREPRTPVQLDWQQSKDSKGVFYFQSDKWRWRLTVKELPEGWYIYSAWDSVETLIPWTWRDEDGQPFHTWQAAASACEQRVLEELRLRDT